MCGIVGYLGLKDASPIILNGLKRLEYRGYDSAGISIYNGNKILTRKSKGKINKLEKSITKVKSFKGNLGIGHTRWATHGEPSNENSHPHTSNSNELHIVHNGIIENYSSLKEELVSKGFHFNSDTDTEVLVNLIEYIQTKEKIKLGEAVQLALNQVVGAYSIAVIDIKKPDEIVVASDERRNNIPVDELFACKIRGIEITEILDFIERETGQIAVNLIYPSWVIYSNGFASVNHLRNTLDWIFNASMAFVLFALAWPIMLLTAILIKLDEGITAPIFYFQERVGLDGEPFNIIKFRSMSLDAEKFGAQMASEDDPRITKIGNVLRKYRIDELPQIYNVMRGDMGFVGPRPERPEFVQGLIKNIPYYNERHNVKPGLTGWAQLKYPYGATEADSLEKLKYDLYYIKHRSFMLDLLILVRTVEIVLFGKGR